MKLYTKKGDKGETSLLDGQRVSKDALRIEAYGTVDELNSALGVARSYKPSAELDAMLARIQDDLFILGADLARSSKNRAAVVPSIKAEHVSSLENVIDAIDARLTPLSSFVLPGGSPVGAQLHVARTICRRVERAIVRLSKAEMVGPVCLAYVNRLSDVLFVLARFANRLDGAQETPWNAPPKP
jgi:cob(I)alamin adenosyltransferase